MHTRGRGAQSRMGLDLLFSPSVQWKQSKFQLSTTDPCASSWRIRLLVSEIVSMLLTGLQHMCPKADTPCRMPPGCLASFVGCEALEVWDVKGEVAR